MRSTRWWLIVMGGLLAACNPQVGYVYLDTIPTQATVYMNEKAIGETPVRFEFDMSIPVTIKLLKEGYRPRTEELNVNWVKSEYRNGRYGKADIIINGSVQKGFQVHTTRELIRAE